MFTRLLRNSRQEMWNAAENTSGGRMTKNTTLGSSETRGTSGTRLRQSPPITRTIGYGMESRFARNASAATSTSNTNSSSSMWLTATASMRALDEQDSARTLVHRAALVGASRKQQCLHGAQQNIDIEPERPIADVIGVFGLLH